MNPLNPHALLNQREKARYSCRPDTICQVWTPKSLMQWPAWVFNVSKTGISLLIATRFHKGERLSVRLENETTGFIIEGEVQVKHSDICFPNDAWLHGCAFINRQITTHELAELVAVSERHRSCLRDGGELDEECLAETMDP